MEIPYKNMGVKSKSLSIVPKMPAVKFKPWLFELDAVLDMGITIINNTDASNSSIDSRNPLQCPRV